MTTASAIWLVVRSLLTLLPMVIAAVKEGRIRNAAYEEVLDALTVSMLERFKKAEEAAKAELPDEATDDNNRNR